jgi:CheY-like chemotaxis protein
MLDPIILAPLTSTLMLEPFVLLVDDHEQCLSLMRELVESAGHHCVTARSAADALLCCDERPPQVVVTDLTMPDLDGRVLCRWVKARYPAVPLVLVTGQDVDGPCLAWLGSTFTAILQKPVDPRRLLALLAELVPRPESAGRAECRP